MPASFAALIGLLLAVALTLLLRRSTVDLIFGLILLGHASNLTVFAGGGLRRGEPPLLVEGAAAHPVADPIPQALVLTAIVIGFSLVAFAIALVARLYAVAGTDDSDRLDLRSCSCSCSCSCSRPAQSSTSTSTGVRPEHEVIHGPPGDGR